MYKSEWGAGSTKGTPDGPARETEMGLHATQTPPPRRRQNSSRISSQRPGKNVPEQPTGPSDIILPEGPVTPSQTPNLPSVGTASRHANRFARTSLPLRTQLVKVF